jgi:hypothetical protein
LAQQFFRTGQWRREVFRRYPDTVSLRYLAAPVAVVLLGAGTVTGVLGLVSGTGMMLAGWAAPAGYALVLLGGTAALARKVPRASWKWLPVVLGTMHITWGAGFLFSPARSQRG